MKKCLHWLVLFLSLSLSPHPMHASNTEDALVYGSTWKHVFTGFFTLCALRSVQAQSEAWIDVIGGINNDFGSDLTIDSEQNFGLTGTFYSYGAGDADVMLSMYNAGGELLSVYSLGGPQADEGFSIKTVDGDFVVVGYTKSGGAGDADLLITKFNLTDVHWSKAFGRINAEKGYSVAHTLDHSFVVVGYTKSSGAGGADWLMVKFSAAGDWEWSRTFGGSGDEHAYKVVVTETGNLVIIGSTTSIGAGGKDLLLASFSPTGNRLWAYTIGGIGDEKGIVSHLQMMEQFL